MIYRLALISIISFPFSFWSDSATSTSFCVRAFRFVVQGGPKVSSKVDYTLSRQNFLFFLFLVELEKFTSPIRSSKERSRRIAIDFRNHLETFFDASRNFWHVLYFLFFFFFFEFAFSLSFSLEACPSL